MTRSLLYAKLFRKLSDLEDRFHDLQTMAAKKDESLHQTQVSKHRMVTPVEAICPLRLVFCTDNTNLR